MRAVVNESECIGCELCADTCPTVFEMVDGVSKPADSDLEGAELDCAREAADICPTEAISISD